MKTENTIDKKVKFFSIYWGLCIVNFRGKIISVHCAIDEKPIADCFLELKPLESISDEDAINIGKYRYNYPKMMTYTEIGKCIISDYLNRSSKVEFQLEQYEIDYLRSKGYALPWMDLSVQDLINYGWVKLIESK